MAAEFAEFESSEEAEAPRINLDEFEATPGGNLSQYLPGTAKFSPDNLETDARRAHDALRDFGIATVTVRYDGGHDEGFAHFESAQSERLFSAEELVEAVKDGTLGEMGVQYEKFAERYAKIPRARVGRRKRSQEFVENFALSQFAGARLRNVGECSIYGRISPSDLHHRRNRRRTHASRRTAR